MGNIDNMLDGDNNDDEVKPQNQKDKVEISCPIFLRPLMKQILSVGKSIKIVRNLERSNIV
jgi:hypothetical protein